jgi:tetratricopeptide (TPR) repeat protein
MKMLCREAADTHPADVEQALTRMSRQLALAYNSASMLKLAQDDIEQAQLLLINAQTLIENSVALLPLQQRNQLTAVTYNNFACVYKRQHDLPAALKYAEQALLLERKDPSAPSPASTHLNLCAILSEMGRHTSAHEQALYALRYHLFHSSALHSFV